MVALCRANGRDPPGTREKWANILLARASAPISGGYRRGTRWCCPQASQGKGAGEKAWRRDCATCDGMLYRKESGRWSSGIGRPRPRKPIFWPPSASRSLCLQRRAQKHLREDIPYGREDSVPYLRRYGDRRCLRRTDLYRRSRFFCCGFHCPVHAAGWSGNRERLCQGQPMDGDQCPAFTRPGDCTGKPLQISKAVGGLIAAQQAALYIDNLMKKGE